jgi:hypothetical protein
MNPLERRRVEITARGSQLTGDQTTANPHLRSRGPSISPGAKSIPSGSLKETFVDDDRSIAIDERKPRRRGGFFITHLGAGVGRSTL